MADVAILSPQIHTFDQRKVANWSTTQEKQISTDYPFTIVAEPLEQHVARTYLQFLWLPESIMPLHLLVPSLKRINPPSSSAAAAQPHPMHAFLEPLLLTPRRTSNKYHTELPQILADGGGAGEMEETMMWYAVTHEKAGGDDHDLVLPEDADGPWVDAKWKDAYLERMERREVQIQILLLMYKLSLPGPVPPPTVPPGKKKKRRRLEIEIETDPDPTTEDYLESYMDKLSTWQLVGALDRPKSNLSAEKQTGNQKSKTDDRDWIQIFAEDIVEREFKTLFPNLCATLRSKVFPSSPFSDTEGDADPSTAPPSPEPQPIPNPRALSRAPSTRTLSRAPSTAASPTLTTSSRTTTSTNATNATRALARSRSRSLSVSLAQEQEQRDRLLYEAQPKKRILNREVSMSRVFKPKLGPSTLEKRKSEKLQVKVEPRARKLDLGVTLVEETPEKPRVLSASLSVTGGSLAFGQPKFGLLPLNGNGNGKTMERVEPPPLPLAAVNELEEDDGEEEWMMDSSPDIVLLNPSSKGRDVSDGMEDEEEEEEETMATPSKPSRSGRGRKRIR